MIDHQDLIEAGWPPSPLFSELIEAARSYEARGVSDKRYVLKLLKRDFGEPARRIGLRREPLAWAEAIDAVTAEDEGNLCEVRRYMKQLMRVPVIEAGAIMPDTCPAGSAEATIPVGGAVAVRDAIIPSAHSADICCSLHATVFRASGEIGEMLDALMASTRFGPGGRDPDDLVADPIIGEDVWDNRFLSGLQHHAAIHMADQGDGNHFAFIGKWTVDRDLVDTLERAGHTEIAGPFDAVLDGRERVDCLALVTHHGSRGLGAHVYKRGQKAAVRETERIADRIPGAAAWLEASSEIGREYWEALQYVGRWTEANHRAIHRRFLERSGGDRILDFGNQHNFVWRKGDLYLHGKGATPAWKDGSGRPLLGLIPLNMAAPILVTLGRDNESYLGFAPHGAGRNLSRTALKRRELGRDGFGDEKRIRERVEEQTRGLDIRWFRGAPDLSESPVAYKSAEQVRSQITQFGLADIVAEIEPLGCVMAGDLRGAGGVREKELTPKQKRQIGHRSERRKTRQRFRDWENDSGDELDP